MSNARIEKSRTTMYMVIEFSSKKKSYDLPHTYKLYNTIEEISIDYDIPINNMRFICTGRTTGRNDSPTAHFIRRKEICKIYLNHASMYNDEIQEVINDELDKRYEIKRRQKEIKENEKDIMREYKRTLREYGEI